MPGKAALGWGFWENPGNFGNFLTHVGVFERSHVVGAVPAHEGGVAQALQGRDHEFLPGKKAGKSSQILGIPGSGWFGITGMGWDFQMLGIQGWNGLGIL